ncbi:MAG: FtsX-like permease family protein [Candidatus Acidiferrum sp.]
MLFFSMAWRNVWRNRRRSLLTVMAIGLGLAFNIFLRGITDGWHDEMVDNSVRAEVGHIQIHDSGYHDEPSINKTLPDADKVEHAIRSLPGVAGYSFRVLGSGLASTADNSNGVEILGVDPAQERTVTTIQRAIVQGDYLSRNVQRPILIGDRLATRLKASLGDKIVLVVQAADGSMGAQLFHLTGIFRSGAPQLDEGVVYILRSDAQSLFSLEGHVTEAVVLLDSAREVQQATADLGEALKGAKVEILPWWEVEPFIKQFIQIDDAFFYVIALIFFVVISIGILNTLTMSIFERTREFGVMMALGTKPAQVVRLVMEEAFGLGLVGVAVGGALGSAATLFYAKEGINLGAVSAGAAATGITSSVVYTQLTAVNLIFSSVAVLAVVLLVALYPAVRASRLKPVAAIRYV